MARIVYGVSGEGSGHSSRAREMASHLLQQGHHLWLASYDRGYRNLKDDFPVLEIEGLCIATAGFTLISEALYFRKPYLALPMQGQFEQELNAYQLEQLGYGKSAARPTAETIGDFLYRLPEFRNRLDDYVPGDNRRIQQKLDELLADGCALARQFHQNRS